MTIILLFDVLCQKKALSSNIYVNCCFIIMLANFLSKNLTLIHAIGTVRIHLDQIKKIPAVQIKAFS